jgi:hypothetical protein
VDPGAVPGASTMVIWGRHRIDTCNKDESFARHGTVVIGLTIISVALTRTRQRKAVAANSNRFGFVAPVAFNMNRKVGVDVAA